ncbi:alpha-amylase family glycosyl hydrolase [Indiicoccus explosivorum]|uniref:alpha-amylase family glycosyl hydrolase n=1 Tax=Indiicoccus explosivorum TaxID=1917864 RepID=UPI001F4DF64F|nr:alpha-amylase family glycosyl hydrolase [Indiicoccus explosivorum]
MFAKMKNDGEEYRHLKGESDMVRKWMAGVIAGLVLLTAIPPVMAEEERTLNDETIYDTLTDRFFNKTIENDFDVDTQLETAFHGGDFNGLIEELDHVEKMGFTMLSIGPVFSTETYDGRTVIDYRKLERHFGTEAELKTLISEAHERGIRLMVDVPTQSLSSEHEWVTEHPEWVTENSDGTFALDTANPEVQEALTEVFADFVQKFPVDGLRLQDTDVLDSGFIRNFAEALENIRPLYLIGDSEMEPVEGLDAAVLPGAEAILRDAYRTTDTDTAALAELMQESAGHLIRIDSLDSSRFTLDSAEENMFPPTRWKLVMAQLLTMPGIPVIQYGSEIAVNGAGPPESHPLLNLRVDEELINKIRDWSSLRNDSEALRTGELEVLAADDGWLVYKRYNDEESWIIAINNTSETQHLAIPAEAIGEGMEMRGLFENDVVRQGDDGVYRITLNRELAEAYHVTEERGLNAGYFIALALVFVLFAGFLWLVWRKGRQQKPAEK